MSTCEGCGIPISRESPIATMCLDCYETVAPETMVSAALQERVQRGIAQLDQYAPGWREKVDIQRLDMSSGTNGLLEQVFAATFYRGLMALHLQFAAGWDYGFDIQPDEDRDEEGDIQEWAELTAAWKTVLGQKQGRKP